MKRNDQDYLKRLEFMEEKLLPKRKNDGKVKKLRPKKSDHECMGELLRSTQKLVV